MIPETAPPYRHVSTRSISLPQASTLLQTFLSNSEGHPHLHPDALITPTGVTFSSHGGPLGGVVMHNLRRVAAGLRGEYMEPEATPEAEGEDEGQKQWAGKKSFGDKGKKDVAETAQEGWQDPEIYEQSVQVEVDEVGKRQNFVAQGGEAPEVEITEEGVEAAEGAKKRKMAEGDRQVDKDARKKAKKERNKELKRQKEQDRVHKA